MQFLHLALAEYHSQRPDVASAAVAAPAMPPATATASVDSYPSSSFGVGAGAPPPPVAWYDQGAGDVLGRSVSEKGYAFDIAVVVTAPLSLCWRVCVACLRCVYLPRWWANTCTPRLIHQNTCAQTHTGCFCVRTIAVAFDGSLCPPITHTAYVERGGGCGCGCGAGDVLIVVVWMFAVVPRLARGQHPPPPSAAV